MDLSKRDRKILERIVNGSNGNPIDVVPTLENRMGGDYCSIQIRSNGKPQPIISGVPYNEEFNDDLIKLVQDVFLVEGYVNSKGKNSEEKRSTVNGKNSEELKGKLEEYLTLRTQLDGYIKEGKLATNVDLDAYNSLFRRTAEARVTFVNLAQKYMKHQDAAVISGYARLRHAFSHIL